MRKLILLSLITILTFKTYITVSQDSTHFAQLTEIVWSPDGTRIAGVYHDSNVSIWDVNDLNNTLLSFQPTIADEIMWTPDSHYLIIQGRQAQEQYLQMSTTKWDATTGEFVEELFTFDMDTHYDFNLYGYYLFPTLAYNHITTQTAFSFRDGYVLISDGVQVLHLVNPVPTDSVRLMSWSPNNKLLAIVYGSSDTYSIQILDVETGEHIQTIYQDFQYYAVRLMWDSTGTYLATLSSQSTCCESWLNVAVNEIEQTEEPIIVMDDIRWFGYEQDYKDIAWHPRETILAIANTDAIEFYDPLVEEMLVSVPAEGIGTFAWSPDGTQIAAVLADNSIEILSVSP